MGTALRNLQIQVQINVIMRTHKQISQMLDESFAI